MIRLKLNNPVGRLRFCGMLEGLSFLVLLFIAMPLKYFFDSPLAVRYVGMIHGGLFILFCLLILIAWLEKRISAKHAGLALIASVIPFGPFLIDRKLADDEVGQG